MLVMCSLIIHTKTITGTKTYSAITVVCYLTIRTQPLAPPFRPASPELPYNKTSEHPLNAPCPASSAEGPATWGLLAPCSGFDQKVKGMNPRRYHFSPVYAETPFTDGQTCHTSKHPAAPPQRATVVNSCLCLYSVIGCLWWVESQPAHTPGIDDNPTPQGRDSQGDNLRTFCAISVDTYK